MKKLSMTVAVSMFTVAAPGLAAAQDANYFALRAGVNDTRQTEFSVDDTVTQNTTVSSKYDTGYNTSLALGRTYDSGSDFNVRTEFELGYSAAEVDSHQEKVVDRSNPVPSTVSSTSLTPAEGDLMVTTGFASVYGEKDLEIVPEANFIFGAGAGVAHVDFDGYGVTGTTVMDDDDVTYGFHLSTGWSYELNEQLALEAMYRYQSIEEVELESESNATSRIRVDSHNFLAGMRYSF
ncbi:MAG: outer membrane protein [Pseudomonadota bacterium]